MVFKFSARPPARAKGDAAAIRQILLCLDDAARGNLKSRVVQLAAPGNKDLAACGNRLNALLDLTEVFAKEADAAMRHANQRKYYRKIITTGFRGDFAKYADTINATLDHMERRDAAALQFAEQQVRTLALKVKEMAAHLKRDANTMLQDSEKAVSESQEASRGASDSANNVQSVAAAAEELSSSFAEVARQAQESRTVTNQAVELARTRTQDVERLKQSADSIGKAADLIGVIARQTNLLALNATIEAARAGEMGRGFSVVAQEIKTLANQTAGATKEITGVVQSMRATAQETADGILEISNIIAQIEKISVMVASSAEEQTVVTQDISRNVGEAARSSGIVASGINNVQESASDTQKRANGVITMIEDLDGMVVRLDGEIEKFIKL